MQKLSIKTLNGSVVLESSPNGGWAWVVTLASFIVYGIAWGTVKTLGIYFVHFKNDFAVSNTAVSWLITAVISTLMFAGLLANLSMRWFDARQLVISGGLLSAAGMVIMSISQHFAGLCFGSFLAGLGFGISSITSMAQISLYFSSWRPLANGIVVTGSTALGTLYPYLNQYLLEEYGWRGGMLVLTAIGLNVCSAGSLIRPITVMAHKEPNETEPSRQATDELTAVRTVDIKTKKRSCSGFLKRYWVALGFLVGDAILCMAMFTPNVFIIPYAEELGIQVSEMVLLLALLSVGDFAGRLGSGIVMSKVKFLYENILFVTTACVFVLSGVEILPIFFSNLNVLRAYVVIYGVTIGAVVTFTLSIVGQILNPRNVGTGIAIMFAVESLTILASGPITGMIVDNTGSFQSIFWFVLIIMLISSVLLFALSLFAKKHGSVIQGH